MKHKQCSLIANNIDISIIIPVYNIEKYISMCISSVFSQEGVKYEIICIDDESTDNSYATLRAFERENRNVRIIRQKHAGQGSARNKGIKLSRGRYILFLDGDDYLKPNVLGEIVKKADETKIDFLTFDLSVEYEDINLRATQDDYYKARKGYCSIMRGMDFFSKLVLNNEYIDSAALMLINSCWLKETNLEFYEDIYYEDALFCLKCFLCAKRVIHYEKEIYVYRIRKNSTMTSKVTYYNVHSKLVVFREGMKVLLNIPESESVFQNAVAKYLGQVSAGVRFYDRKCEENRLFSDNINNIDDLLEQVFRIGEYKLNSPDEKLLLFGFDKCIEDASDVVLYGAGEIGKTVYNYIKAKKLGYKICAFSKSKVENDELIDGLCVKAISSFSGYPGRIILTASKHNQKEMLTVLERLKIKDYILLDIYTINAIRAYLGGGNT